MLEFSLIILFSIGLYSVILYPLFLFFYIVRVSKKNIKDTSEKINAQEPTVSFIVPVFNGQAYIEKKITNTLEIEYPRKNIEFIFVTDGCSDNTVNLIKKYPQIKLLELVINEGKEKALQVAMKHASGEIFVFSDISVLTNKDSIHHLINKFSDPTVGAVSSVDRLDEKKISIKSLYLKYEMLVRRLESHAAYCVGVSGSLFAARKDLCLQLENYGCSDLQIVFICFRNGFRTIVSKRSIGSYSATATQNGEFRRLRRTFAHGIYTFFKNYKYMNAINYGFFSIQLISHKLLRWILLAFLCIVSLQLAFIVLTIATREYSPGIVLGVTLVFSYFAKEQIVESALIFSALVSAILMLIFHKRFNTWQPTNRKL